jgi:hypothetical protein
MSAHITLNYRDTESAMDLLLRARRSVMIYSPPGHGKTSMIRQRAIRKGPSHGLFELNGSISNLPDFGGWFYRSTEHYTDYDGNDVTIENGRYTFPYMLFCKITKRPIFQFKSGTLVIEEYGQTEIELKKSLGQLLLEHRINQYDLPEDLEIVMLSNYSGGRDAVGRDFDYMVNRRSELHMRQDIDSSLVYMHERGFLNASMAFASLPVHHVFDTDAPKEQGPWLTPRSFEGLDATMREIVDSKTKLDDPVARQALAGLVGQGAAYQYIAFYQLKDQIPTVDEIVKDPDGTRLPDRTKTDQMMFLIFNMADKAEKGNIKQLVRYMARMPGDMAVAFYRNALMRDKSLMQCREFGDWAVANKSLLAIVNSRV